MSQQVRKGGRQDPRDDGTLSAAEIAILVQVAGGGVPDLRGPRAPDLRRLQRRGWIETAPDGVVLTARGRGALAACGSEGGAARAATIGHADVPDDEGRPRTVRRNDGESPLAWLRRRRQADGKPMLDDAAFAAGERFRVELTRAMMLPRVTSNWDGAGGGRQRPSGPAEASDAALAARQRVAAASRAVGHDLSGLLVDVCGFLKGLEDIERDRGWPARSAKVVLQIALGRLAEHYGYRVEVRGPDHSAGIRAWTAEP